MQNVLIDTDVAIDFLKGKETIKKIIFPLLEKQNAFLSILSCYELYAGMRKEETIATNKFISACQITPISLEIAESAGSIYQHYRAKGVTLTSIDCMIFASAKELDYKILTRNVKHYPDTTLLFKH